MSYAMCFNIMRNKSCGRIVGLVLTRKTKATPYSQLLTKSKRYFDEIDLSRHIKAKLHKVTEFFQQ